MDNEALSYFRDKIEEGKQANRVRFDITKGRLKRFPDKELSDAISALVAEGVFVADYTETTKPYNKNVNNDVTNYLRIEWD
jgi:translation elongation factor EF-Ts